MRKPLIYLFLLILFIGCQNSHNIEGNYSLCNKGSYMEVYFKKDSMRVASENDWVKLSNWRKIKFKNDTLHFETFGEWRDSSKAILKYVETNKVKYKNLRTGDVLFLYPFNDKLNFNNPEKFWKGFYKRNNNNCE